MFKSKAETKSHLIASDTDQCLHVASLVVQVLPAHKAALCAWLLQQGVEVHSEGAEGKLVVVMETHNQRDILDVIDAIPQQTGALSAALVYHEVITEEREAS